MDKITARKNLEQLESDRVKLLSLNHLNSREEFKQACARRIREINKAINNIKLNLGIGNGKSY